MTTRGVVKTKTLNLGPIQMCFYCKRECEDWGLVENDDLDAKLPALFAVCRQCAIRTGLATDDYEWEEELRIGAPG